MCFSILHGRYYLPPFYKLGKWGPRRLRDFSPGHTACELHIQESSLCCSASKTNTGSPHYAPLSVYLLGSVNEKARLLYPRRRRNVAHPGLSTQRCCKATPGPTCIVKTEQELEERFHPKRSRVRRASGHQTLWPRVMRPSQGCC